MKPSPTTAGAAWRDPWIATALLAALALRVTMARGGLWLDEAWSAVMAHDVGTPMGVIAGINHDNNHPLNSWWLQLVGLGAPPLLARALSIICSVGTILPAATFATRRGAAAGRAAAWLFALSPTLVLLGSEARGYAPALLALVILVDQVDPLRDGPPPSPTTLAMIGLFGTLGHLLMLPAICLVGAWLVLARRDLRAAVGGAVRALAPAFAASLAVASLLFGAAYLVKGGIRIGSTTPFDGPAFAAALLELVQMTLGVAGGLLLVLIIVGPPPSRTDVALGLALGLGLPVAAVLFQVPNTHISRYFVMSSLVLLWLVATRFGAQIQGRRVHRVVACALLGGILMAMATTDARVIGAARGEPDLPVRL
ncbi:MAG: hypothetical protein ABIR77_08100, partial [Sphingomicrobium sp.]